VSVAGALPAQHALLVQRHSKLADGYNDLVCVVPHTAARDSAGGG
jgi:hypothetical protein